MVLQRERKQEGSEQAQRRLQQAIESFNASAKLPYPLRLSVGVICQDSGTQADIDSLLAAADARMYEIKRAKRQQP